MFDRVDKGYEMSETMKVNGDGDGLTETVELVATCYEWICPECFGLNEEPEVKVEVTCRKCGVGSKVSQARHGVNW
jgi:hypothetical protein